MVDLPAEIRAQRARKGISQREAAAEIGVSESTYFRWEQGEQLSGIRPLLVLALSEWLGVMSLEVLRSCAAIETRQTTTNAETE
jgi:transcriptional regulator with XRE-family HTH domain